MRETLNLKPSPAEKARWREAAAAAGLALHAWARRALNETAGLEEALRREQERADAAYTRRRQELDRVAFAESEP
jgi:hypothetical protein